MQSYLNRITFNPKQCGGRPCIRGMRIRVKDIVDLLGAGLTSKEVLAEMPDLEAEDILASIQFARMKEILARTLQSALDLLRGGEQLVEVTDVL